MQLYSTKNQDLLADLKKAVLQGLPEDNGLYMPVDIPRLPSPFLEDLKDKSFQEIGFTICQHLFEGYIPDEKLQEIIQNAISFPAPVVDLNPQQKILELFHGPSLAFKDFGARFMAQLMSHFNQGQEKDLTILVATSGDTGGAVAAGFLGTPGIRVVILYPSGKVSPLQEKQLTTLGQNITALEVEGTFDDCQAMVKQAFLDKELTQKLRLSSANSINIARLIPQSFYYFEAYKQLEPKDQPVVFCVPSGNFGNLTAGLFAQKMGLPIHHFIAATNVNDVVPAYLKSGNYQPKPSVRTLSNAMDVGKPSNFARMQDLFKGKAEGSTWNNLKDKISGYAFTDTETETAVREVFEQYQYIIDPHGAVGYLALNAYQKEQPNTLGVILETAHPSKFKEEVDRILEIDTPVPERLAILADRSKQAHTMPMNYPDFKDWLLG
ncbi:MAG TPA: threonine synthase [Saprospiraceae bacterium]|nr:threonine synthase [Saprospiraceae bacterium]